MGRSGWLRGLVNKGPWTPDEDLLLTRFIEAHGEGHWNTLPQRAGLTRCGKSCRLRWKNYLRPNVKRGHISLDEEELIIRLHKLLGNRWALIAGRVPGRTDNEIKNYWNTRLSKKASGICTRRKAPVDKHIRSNANATCSAASRNNLLDDQQVFRNENNGNPMNNHSARENTFDLSVIFAERIEEQPTSSRSDAEQVQNLLMGSEESYNPSLFDSNNTDPVNLNAQLQLDAAMKEHASVVPYHADSIINASSPRDIEIVLPGFEDGDGVYSWKSHLPSWADGAYSHMSHLPVEWMTSDLLDVPQGVLDCNYMQYNSEQDYGSSHVSDLWSLI